MIVPPWRLRLIVSLSLPIVLILLAQTLIGLIAIALVSHLGDAAVAGTGIASGLVSLVMGVLLGMATPLLSMLMAVLFGIDTGVQALVAQRIGAGQVAAAATALSDGLAIAILGGLLLTALGYIAGPGLFALVTRDAAVAAHGLPYLRATLPMLLFIGANFAFSAYRNGEIGRASCRERV